MISPTEKDIGRGVIYTDSHNGTAAGVIISMTDNFVFVRYGKEKGTVATSRQHLTWEHPDA